MSETLDVFLHREHIGEVARGRSRSRIDFHWDRGYSPGTVTLTEAFGVVRGVDPASVAVSNQFGGYAPEGNQRAALADQRGLDPADLFGLLREFGASIAGALTFARADEPADFAPRYDPLSTREVASRLRQALEKHDLGVQADSRSMIPGFQPKLLLARFDDQWFAPHGRAHSTHILKPRLRSRPQALYDEFYSHRLARRMGLSSFASDLHSIGQTDFLAIERFDRTIHSDQRVVPVHQEDLAQALGLDWVDAGAKFQDPRTPRSRVRPSAYRIAEVTGSLSSDSNPTVEWLRQLTYHVLIGNNDAHAKNVSLQHLDDDTRLSEIYDAVPGMHHEGRIDFTMAMAINDVFDHREVTVEHLIAEATGWAVLNRTVVTDTISDTLTAFASAVDAIDPPRRSTPGLRERLMWNVTRLRAGDAISEPKPGRLGRATRS